MWPGAPRGRTPAGRSAEVIAPVPPVTKTRPPQTYRCNRLRNPSLPSAFPVSLPRGGVPVLSRRSGEDLRMLLQLQPRAAHMHDEHPLGVVGIRPADAVKQQAVL